MTPSHKKNNTHLNRISLPISSNNQVPMSKYDGSQKAANNVKINKQNDIEVYAISSRGTKMSKKKENCYQ